jgi:hypothetical protein
MTASKERDGVRGWALEWAPALAADVQRHLQLLGIQTLRVSVLDTRSLEFQWAGSISDQGQVQVGDAQLALDSVFPGGSATVLDLTRQPLGHTSVQKQSPRRWLLAWRLRDDEAVMVDAQFHDRRDVFSETDGALLRLLCNSSLARTNAGRAAADTGLAQATDTQAHTLVWPQIERRAGTLSPRARGVGTLMLAVALLSCLWLLLFGAPQMQRHALAQDAEFASLRDGTLRSALSLALATGDYGEVQGALQNLSELGHFESAAVVNDKQRVVAISGEIKNQRIGDNLSAEYRATTRQLNLATGSQQQGQLLYVVKPSPAADLGKGLWIASGLAAVGSLVGLLVLLLPLLNRRRPGA